MEASSTGWAVVIYVVDGYFGHAELVEYSLATGGVAVAVAGDALVDVVVVDLCIKHGFDASFETELGVVDFASGLDEFGHAYA